MKRCVLLLGFAVGSTALGCNNDSHECPPPTVLENNQPCFIGVGGAGGSFSIASSGSGTASSASSTMTTASSSASTGAGTLLEQAAVPCQGAGNVLYFDGDATDGIHPGMDTITAGTWTVMAGTNAGVAAFFVVPTDMAQGSAWQLTLEADDAGTALATKIYEDAERYMFQAPGHPGMAVTGNGKGCDTIAGRFQVFEVEYMNNAPVKFMASFEQHCNGNAAELRGCVRYEAP
jgi:hypothetical protein